MLNSSNDVGIPVLFLFIMELDNTLLMMRVYKVRIWCMWLTYFFRILYIGMCAKSLQSCLTLCNPLDCSPPGSSVHGILQARILEWVAMPFSRGSSQPKD